MSRLDKASSRRATQPPRWLRALLFLISALLSLGGCADPPSSGGDDERVGSAEQAVVVQAPTITGFTPASGAPGDVVSLSGSGFVGTTGVKLGKIAVAFTFVSDVLITATVPAGALSATFSVTKAGGTGTSAATFIVSPTLTSFTPASGVQGTAVTVKGQNLLDTTAVSFGGVASTTITSITATSVVATVPAGAGTGTITVTTAGGTATSAKAFDVLPALDGFTPLSGPVGTTVTLTGTELLGAAVSFGAVAATTTTVTDTTVTTTVPASATTGKITVTTAGGAAKSAGTFTVVVAPTIKSFSPTSGPPGTTTVGLKGTGFTDLTGVSFGGVPSTDFTVTNATTATAVVPAAAVTGTITVTNAAGSATSTGIFTVTDPCAGITCVALDPCHVAGTCSLGVCSNPPAADGTPCDDGNTCTKNDVCTGGSCAGTTYACPAPGAPSFAASEYLANCQYPDDAVVKDVNGDGKPDVVVNCGYGISVLLGNGDGTLRPGVTYTSGSGGNGLALADVNGDGKLDAVTFEGTYGVMVFLGNGDGTFGAPLISPTIIPASDTTDDDTWLDVGDLDGDGIPDVVVIHAWESTLAVMLGNGDGTFQTEVDYPALGLPYPGSAGFVALADFNRDGHLDVLVGNVNGSSVSVLLGNGDGTMGAPTDFPVGEGGFHQAVGDMNGDGLLDVVQVGDNGQVSILLGNGDGTFLPYQAFNCGFQGGFPSVALGDFDGDGKLDVAVVIGGTGQGRASILLGNGDGTLGAPLVLPTPAPSANILAAADLRGDGKVDLIIPLSDASGEVAVLLNTRVSAQCVAAGTCNGDGTCSFADLPDGTACDDGNACTQADQCTGGVCVGTPLACLPPGAGNTFVAGEIHSLAIKPDGTVWASGYNQYGALGNGTLFGSDVPVQATGLTGAISLAIGDEHSFALKSDGTVWSWGSGYGPQQLTPSQVAGFSGGTAIAGTYHHVVALKSDGTVWAWGDNTYGQLGDGTFNSSIVPVQAVGVSGVTALATGLFHTMALRSDGTLWVWGNNDNGQLADGTTTARATPIQVPGISGVAKIAAAGFSCLALKSDGSLWVWGSGGFGELGNGTNDDSHAPIQVTTISGVTSIAAGDGHVLALKSDGTVWTWGWNNWGQLGDGTTSDRNLPVQAVGLSGVTTLAPAFDGSLVMRSDGTLWGWGLDDWGQLADGTMTPSRPTPEQSLLP